MNTTFVTCIYHIYDKDYNINKTLEARIEHFKKIAKLNIVLYVNRDYEEIIGNLIKDYDNIKLIVKELDDTFIYNTCKNFNLRLPEERDILKDTYEFMILKNLKIEFLAETIMTNPFNTEYFAWIDFSIAYIFKNDNTIDYIKNLSLNEKNILYIPGCWNFKVNDEVLINKIVWRFCGNFIIGDNIGIMTLYLLYSRYFIIFLQKYNVLTWDTNFWSWLENNTEWTPNFYNANHDDSIVMIPIKHILKNYISSSYDYINIENFHPSSSSYVYFNNKHILNTRFINYTYEGDKVIKNQNVLNSLNICSELDDNLIPINYNIMNNDTINLKCNFDDFSIGLEDIRLYIFRDQLKFIATNVCYTPRGYNRMIIGNYDINNYSFSNCKMINMQNESEAQKNWIPINVLNMEAFIYKWNPYEIGTYDMNNNYVSIKIKKYNDKIFESLKGSTNFVKLDNYLVGLVHYRIIDNEPKYKADYYHILMALDNISKEPIKYSDPFKFSDGLIEFCLGMTIEEENYVFWVSFYDNNPRCIKIPIENIEIKNIAK